MSSSSYSLVGNASVTRQDLMNRINGTRHWTADISASDIGASSMVYMGRVLSPHPSALIKSIDVSKAEAAGYTVLTAADLPAYNFINQGRNFLPLARGSVLYAGQPVAAVASTDPDTVQDGIDLVDVAYEPQPYVFDPEEALKPGAPQLYPGGNSLTGPEPVTISYGDAASALSAADAVVSQRFDYPILQHFQIEPSGCVAWWTGGQLYVWERTNYAFGDQSSLASYFGIPVSDVVCRVALGGTTHSANGGMFGNSSNANDLVIAAAMSQKVGAPVKWVGTRFADARSTNSRFPTRCYCAFGGTKAGLLTAMQVNMYYNMGAVGGSMTDGADDFYNTYVVPNLEINQYVVSTNAYSMGTPMRDVGESQTHFAMESTIDMLADQLGIDPVTFRLNNMRTSATATDPVAGTPYSTLPQPQVFNSATSAFNWTSLWKGWGVPSSTSGSIRYGVGLALESCNKGGYMPVCWGQITVNPDGSVAIYNGQSDQGGGTTTTLPLLAAQFIGLSSLENVTYYSGDTSVTSDSGGTFGSLGTMTGGLGVLSAATALGRAWFPIVAAALAPGTKASNLAFGGGIGAGFSGVGGSVSPQPSGIIYDTTNPSNQMTFQQAAALLSAPLTVTGYGPPSEFPGLAFTHRDSGTKIAMVAVDTLTADAEVVSVVSALDIGRVVFAKGARSQLEGAFIGLGMGEALFEEVLNDPTTGLARSGSYLNPNYLDMKIPTIMQAPSSFTCLPYESLDPTGPFGAKGMGEDSLCATSAAIANAMSNALGGYRFTSVPMRKEDIVAALQWMQANGKL